MQAGIQGEDSMCIGGRGGGEVVGEGVGGRGGAGGSGVGEQWKVPRVNQELKLSQRCVGM